MRAYHPLGHARGLADDLLFLRVIVDLEVFGLKNPEVERVVLDLVSAEVLASAVAGSQVRCPAELREAGV